MSVSQKRVLFTQLLGQLLTWCAAHGLAVALDEARRPPETAALYAAQGRGSKNSLHCLGLAVDLVLYVGGIYQKDAAPYRQIGEQWEALHELCRWGGRFKKVDAAHFSMSYQGRA